MSCCAGTTLSFPRHPSWCLPTHLYHISLMTCVYAGGNQCLVSSLFEGTVAGHSSLSSTPCVVSMFRSVSVCPWLVPLVSSLFPPDHTACKKQNLTERTDITENLKQVRLVSAKAKRPNHPSRGGGGVLHTNDNDDVTPQGRFDLQSCSA